MKTIRSLNFLSAALTAGLALTSARAADLTPADSSAVALTKEETKAIAEEGFIYGLPIVMNYAVMYEYMVVGPGWKGKTPPGIKKVFRSSTQFSAVAYRTQLFNPEDMPNVVKIQAGYKVRSLSQYLKQPAPPAPRAVDFPKANAALVKTSFFDYLAFALQFAPAEPQEKEIREKLARLGVEAGKKFDLAI